MATPSASTEGIFLPSFPEQTGTPVAFDRDIFTLQALTGA